MLRHRIIRRRCKPLLAKGSGLFLLANQAMGQDEQAARFGKLRVNSQSLAVAGNRFRDLIGRAQQAGQVVVGISGFRSKLDGGAVFRFSVLKFALRPQQNADVVMHLGMAGVDSQRFAIGGNRLLQPALLLQHIAKIVVPISLLRRMLKALRNQRDGFIAMTQLVCQNAKKMQRRRMLRLNRQHFPVQGLSLDQLALLVAFDGAYHRFLGGELPFRAW